MDLILLIYLCIQLGKKAREKGLSASAWRWRLVIIWISFELFGFMIGAAIFGFNRDDILGLALFAFACAFGGYLLVKTLLDKAIVKSEK